MTRSANGWWVILSEALGWDGLDGGMKRLMFHKDIKCLRRGL